MGTTRVLVEAENYYPSVELTHNFLKQAAKILGFDIRFLLSKRVTRQDVNWCDIAISIRGISLISARISRICRESGRLYFYAIDDNLFMHRRTDRFMRQRQAYLQECLDNANVVITPNPYLGDYLLSRSRAGRYVVLNTVVDTESIYPRSSFPDSTECKLVYYSNDGSTTYCENVLLPVFREIPECLKRPLTIDFIGMNELQFSAPKGIELRYLPHMQLSTFRRQLAEGGYQLGLAPLNIVDDGFSKYKYFNKYIEFTMAGIPGIYSNCPPYNFVIKDGYNGILCDNSPKSWMDAVVRCATDPEYRTELVQNARNHLLTEHSVSAVMNRLNGDIPELSNFHAGKDTVNGIWSAKIGHQIFLNCERADSVSRYMKERGFRDTIGRIREYITGMRQNQRELQSMRNRDYSQKKETKQKAVE